MSRSVSAPPTAGNVPAAHGYRVVGPIGAGATTLLEEAVSRTGRRVAIKRGRRGVGPVHKALLAEASVLGRLSHPNVVLFIEKIGDDTDPQLVLELLEGQTLRALLEARVRLPFDVAGRIGYDLAEALAHLHEHGVVHGDLSPDNVFVTDAGVVKLIDFGSARSLESSAAPAGTFATPGYVAPERLLGEPGDAKSDLFSLGVLLYEAVSGHSPWSETDAAGRAARTLVPLAARVRDVPRRLEHLVHELLSRNPADRPTSAEEVIAALGPRVAALSPRELRTALTQGDEAPAEARAPWRQLALRYVAVLGAFVVLASLLRLLLGERVARADVEGAAGELAGETAHLRVVAKPWAEVWIDGRHVDTTPFATPLALAPGAHTLTLKHPLAPSSEREVVAVAGQDVTVRHAFDVPRQAPKPAPDEAAPVKREKMP
jgi:eukaryotic-like serine/threonine-protein kinase